MHQQEQGLRYVAGSKALRHYHNCHIAFRIASKLDPNAFDPIFNAARVRHQLAVEHLPSPECYTALEEAVADYERAAAIALARGEDGDMDRVDAMFNLGQACVELDEMLHDGALYDRTSPSEGPEMRDAQFLLKAKQLFAEVERIQTVAVERDFGRVPTPSSDVPSAVGDDAMVDDDTTAGGTANGQASSVVVEPKQLITPRMLVDTLMELVSVDLALVNRSSESDTPQEGLLKEHANSAMKTFERAHAWTTSLKQAAPDPELAIAMEMLRLNLSSTLLSSGLGLGMPLTQNDIARAYEALLDPSATSEFGNGSQNVELLSAYADHLIDTLPAAHAEGAVMAQVDRAQQLYKRADTILSDMFAALPYQGATRPQARTVPRLRAANATSRAQAELQRGVLLYSDDQSKAAQRHEIMSEARRVAQEAVNFALSSSTGTAYKLVEGSNPGDGRNSWDIKPCPPQNSLEALPSWPNFCALRSAWWTLARVELYRKVPSPMAWLTTSWPRVSGRDARSDLLWYVKMECVGDCAWNYGHGAEGELWKDAA